MKRAHILFCEDVAGTGYRFFMKQKAIELGLKGFIQLNNINHIEVEVEGNNAAVGEFIHFVQKGVTLQVDYNGFNVEIFDDLKGYSVLKSDIV